MESFISDSWTAVISVPNILLITVSESIYVMRALVPGICRNCLKGSGIVFSKRGMHLIQRNIRDSHRRESMHYGYGFFCVSNQVIDYGILLLFVFMSYNVVSAPSAAAELSDTMIMSAVLRLS